MQKVIPKEKMRMLKNISDRLQNHPIAITLMFFVSMLGSVITVILGWEQFYNDYLSKTDRKSVV